MRKKKRKGIMSRSRPSSPTLRPLKAINILDPHDPLRREPSPRPLPLYPTKVIQEKEIKIESRKGEDEKSIPIM